MCFKRKLITRRKSNQGQAEKVSQIIFYERLRSFVFLISGNKSRFMARTNCYGASIRPFHLPRACEVTQHSQQPHKSLQLFSHSSDNSLQRKAEKNLFNLAALRFQQFTARDFMISRGINHLRQNNFTFVSIRRHQQCVTNEEANFIKRLVLFLFRIRIRKGRSMKSCASIRCSGKSASTRLAFTFSRWKPIMSRRWRKTSLERFTTKMFTSCSRPP